MEIAWSWIGGRLNAASEKTEIEQNLTDRIAEARDNRVWLGEVTGLQETLAALRTKTEHARRLATAGITDDPAALT